MWLVAHTEARFTPLRHLPFMHNFFCWEGGITGWGAPLLYDKIYLGYRAIFFNLVISKVIIITLISILETVKSLSHRSR